MAPGTTVQMSRRVGNETSKSREVLRSGWIPAALTLALAVAVSYHYGVAARQTVAFGAFAVLGVAVPGTLLARALRGHAAGLAEDVALGTALGHGMTVLAYVPARWAGLPLLVLAWPVATIVAFVMVPALRPYWRGADRADRAPIAFSWGLATFVALTVVASATSFFRAHRLAWSGHARPYVDMLFHLSVVGELKHHVPPTSPFVLGEPLQYHWFVYADMAATSWVTGIESETLLYRLFLLPVLAATVLLFAAIARRLTGRWWPALVAPGLALFALCPNPCAWAPGLGADFVLRYSVPWCSPTQTFGVMLFASVVLLLVTILRQSRSGKGPWTMFAILITATSGAKSVFLPMLFAGLIVVSAVTLLARRRLHRPAVIAVLMVTAALVFAQIVIYGGASDGLVVHPLSVFSTLAADIGSTAEPSLTLKLAVVVACVFGLGCFWIGVFLLGLRPRTLLDAPVLLLLGIGAAGFAAGVVLRFPGSSQRYFLYGATPYLCLAAVHGLAAVLPRPDIARSRSVPALVGALAGGIAVILTVRRLDGTARPEADEMVRRIVGPVTVLVLLIATLAVTLLVAGRRRLALRAMSPGVVAAFVMGLAVPASVAHVKETWHNVSAGSPTTVVPPGTVEAGRWLRDHSRPDDVVATNAICTASDARVCDLNHFSVAAYTERRLLVETWIYEMRTQDRAAKEHVDDASVPFWDGRRLADDDAAFHHPSPGTVRRLRDRYGVRWLFVDRREDPPAPGLDRVARLRYAAGDWAVYEI
ncbi:hypothetical protein [Actinoallomurus sp. NPDC052274]|uniref:hypothetical protein n=1 Tax=Actinoallomurus sp. NPDC052274 TaxID=3155420 RepID=UPI00342AE83B